jgi:hypothetical protein
MKMFYLVPLLFMSACSTAPKLVLHPQPQPLAADTVRYPEVLHAYHIGRYADPNDDSLMHEHHVVYRVEENTRWSLRTATMGNTPVFPAVPLTRDAAFSPAPVNDAILAEVNSQRLATTAILMQARTLSTALAQFQTALAQTKTNVQETARLRASVNAMKQRLESLETAPAQRPATPISTTNKAPDSLSP